MHKKTVKDFMEEQSKKAADDFSHANLKSQQAPADARAKSDIPGLQIFNPIHIKDRRDASHKSRLRDELDSLSEEPLWKPFSRIHSNTLEKLDALEAGFPNFSMVVRLCRTNITLCNLEKPGILQLPPMLLSGPPGIGKTLFMESLSKALSTPFFSLDMSTISTGFIISGGTSAWSDSKPGFISESLRKSTSANPIVMLDEIDKVSGSLQFDPLAPFYSLFEEHTAKRFVDEFLEIPMNASGVIWVATANYPEQIPAPIRSRMRVIEISPPDESQAAAVARSVYQSILVENRWGKHFNPALNDDVLRTLVALPPRQMRQSLREAMGQAVLRSGDHHRPVNLIEKDIPEPDRRSQRTRGIGFLASL